MPIRSREEPKACEATYSLCRCRYCGSLFAVRKRWCIFRHESCVATCSRVGLRNLRWRRSKYRHNFAKVRCGQGYSSDPTASEIAVRHHALGTDTAATRRLCGAAVLRPVSTYCGTAVWSVSSRAPATLPASFAHKLPPHPLIPLPFPHDFDGLLHRCEKTLRREACRLLCSAIRTEDR